MEYKNNSKLTQYFNGVWYLNSALSFIMGMAAYPYTHFWGLVCIAVGFICMSTPTIRKIMKRRILVDKMKREGYM